MKAGAKYKPKVEKFKNLEDAQAAFDAQSEELNALKKDNKSLVANVKELEELIADVRATKTKGKTPSFKHKAGEFEITAGKVNFEGKVYTAEEIAKNKDLQNKLVELGAGFLAKKG